MAGIFRGRFGAGVVQAIAVALGTAPERYLTMLPLKPIAGLGFIAVGVWTVASHFRGA